MIAWLERMYIVAKDTRPLPFILSSWERQMICEVENEAFLDELENETNDK